MNSWSLETARWSTNERSVAYHVHLPVHRRLAVNQLTTLHWSLKEALVGFRRGGVPAIGLNFGRMKERGLEHAIDEVRASGLMVSSVGWVGGFTGGCGTTWEQAVQEARLAIWTAGQVGAQAVLVVTGPRRTHIRTHARRIVVEALSELAPVAQKCGVKLALQPMHPVCASEWTFLHALDEALEMLAQVAHPWAGLAYSPYHLWHELGLLTRIPAIIERIASVQLSDWHRSPRDANDRALPGDGCLPLADHVAALEEAGYRGLYEIDPWSRDLWKLSPHGLITECRRRFERVCASHISLGQL
jgi:sugar phosphate isomerase/epimerase